MRIPVYTAPGEVTTEAPGRSIRARMNAQPFIEQAKAQGDVIGAVAEAADQYASTRYKVLVENQLNEALLGADEAMRTRADELVKSRDYRQALDGDDPIWNRETAEMRARLRDTVGRDVYALQQFDARFNQTELQTRFRMRGDIDRRIVAEAAAARAQALTRFEQNLAQGVDIAAADLAAREIGINSDRWAASGAGNPNALESQEYGALVLGTYGALENLFNTSSSPSRTIGNIKVALREGDPTLAGPEGLYAYTLLQRLNLEDRARLLRGVGATFDFFDAPTAEEEAAIRLAARTGQAAGEQAETLAGQLSSGVPVTQEAIQSVRAQLESVAPAMSPEDFAAAARQVDDLEYIAGIHRSISRTADLTAIDNAINDVRVNGIGEGAGGVDTDRERVVLNYLEAYRSNMATAIQEDPISWVRSTGAVGAVPNIDISAGAIQSGDTGLSDRVAFSERAQAFYGLPEPTIFGKQDAQNIVSQIQSSEFELALGQVATLQAQLGQYADIGIRELEAAGLAPELVEAMYVTDANVQRELVQLAGVETSALVDAANRSGVKPTDVRTELATIMRNYMVAFEAGGGPRAMEIANQQFAIAERLALSRTRNTSQSPAEIAQGVVADLLPPEENWVVQRNQLFIAPRGVDANEVQIAAERMASEDMLRAAGIAPLDNPALPEYVDAEVNIAALATNGVWLNNSTGDGVVLHYEFGDGQYLPAMRTDGQPYQLLFVDAAGEAQRAQDSRLEEFEGMMVAP